jgi:hypothetical protein
VPAHLPRTHFFSLLGTLAQCHVRYKYTAQVRAYVADSCRVLVRGFSIVCCKAGALELVSGSLFLMSSGLMEDVSAYISACRQVSAGKLSVRDSEFASAARAVDYASSRGFFHNDSGWADEDRALCMQMLSEQAHALPDIDQWIDMFFVTADAELFTSATGMFASQYDMLGAILASAEGPENLEMLLLLCMQLDIQPFRIQDVHEHISAEELEWCFVHDPEKRRAVNAWKEAHCCNGIKDGDGGEGKDAVGKEPAK